MIDLPHPPGKPARGPRRRPPRRSTTCAPPATSQQLADLVEQLRELGRLVQLLEPAEQAAVVAAAEQALEWFVEAGGGVPVPRGADSFSTPLDGVARRVLAVDARLAEGGDVLLPGVAVLAAQRAQTWLDGLLLGLAIKAPPADDAVLVIP